MVTLGGVDPGFGPRDDLRHWPAPGGKMRDSLFWELIMPEERLGMQIYLYLTDRGKTGYNVSVWGPGTEPVALKLASGGVPADMDFDNFEFQGLTVKQPELRRSAEVVFHDEELTIEYTFAAIHDAFSYRSNPDGLPAWFAENRLEQTGRVTGFIDVGGRRIEWDRMGHRDHSWGNRNWGIPHHWKWFVAYTESGRAVNGWIWIAKGEWGFAGYVVKDGVTVPVSHIKHKASYNEDMTQRRLDAELIDIAGESTHLVLDSYGVVKLPTNDKMATEIWEAACTATIDGEVGAGQFETHWPTPYLQHLIESKA
ncbi:DUF7064 domain-containing protein [Protofrankia symbiont of Coriaria ruscifolia]|uniref:DUF7064 domain-containing protein n=1 Tax=Candidatus Protofrankia californiensis TaxID=1839754 RepID=A0A1C3NYZ3_9ACTN|nr:hypothetical protein [Protofrankia symbiont of Coriaria ruscifolia]SBW22767.1 hypothetical protein FDG2_3102 [Candidatus Protofrankia californiensis]